MPWWDQLDKTRGSRPRSVLITDGAPEQIATWLTALVGHPDVAIQPPCTTELPWMPRGLPILKPDGAWDVSPAAEAKLGEPNDLVDPQHQLALQDWWLKNPRNANTPNWDIASRCLVRVKSRRLPGLLLVEAKAHVKELGKGGKKLPTTQDGWANHEQVGRAISDASAAFQKATAMRWAISRDRHYQLSYRFAWSWKLASLGIPVVLVYLGFLNAQDVAGEGTLFYTADDWTNAMMQHGEGVIPWDAWNTEVKFADAPVIPLLRVYDQPFDPAAEG